MTLTSFLYFYFSASKKCDTGLHFNYFLDVKFDQVSIATARMCIKLAVYWSQNLTGVLCYPRISAVHLQIYYGAIVNYVPNIGRQAIKFPTKVDKTPDVFVEMTY